MIGKIKTLIISLALSVSLGAPAMVPAVASAAEANNITKNLCQGVNSASEGTTSEDCSETGGEDNSLKDLATKVVNLFSIIVGIVAVIMIIYGGFRYITSGGDSGRVGSAKNTLIYAIIGLIIVALAQFIVHYVLQTATNSVQ
jgi:Type IV secretion system pilin